MRRKLLAIIIKLRQNFLNSINWIFFNFQSLFFFLIYLKILSKANNNFSGKHNRVLSFCLEKNFKILLNTFSIKNLSVNFYLRFDWWRLAVVIFNCIFLRLNNLFLISWQ